MSVNTSNQQAVDQSAMESFTHAFLSEQRTKRRWGIFFKLVFLAYLIVLLILIFGREQPVAPMVTKPHTAMIDIDGIISEGRSANADSVIDSLDDAFKNKEAKGIILQINSPGGSPVQASMIYNEVKRQEKLHPNTKVYAVCTDACASAAYFIAASADTIYANPASLVGSIGALIDGFGFVDAMNKLGVQRRLITAGKNKGFLDPFSPMNSEDRVHAQEMLDDVHQQFEQAVIDSRGQRLKLQDRDQLFSGWVWTGHQALQLGLIDGYASTRDVARNMIKQRNIVDYTQRPGLLDRIAERVGAKMFAGMRSELLDTWFSWR